MKGSPSSCAGAFVTGGRCPHCLYFLWLWLLGEGVTMPRGVCPSFSCVGGGRSTRSRLSFLGGLGGCPSVMGSSGITRTPPFDGTCGSRPMQSIVGLSIVPDSLLQLGGADSQRFGGCQAEMVRSRLLSGGFSSNHQCPASAVWARVRFCGWLVDIFVSLGVAAVTLPREIVAILVAVGSKRRSFIEVIQ